MKGLFCELYAEYSRLHGIYLGKPLNPRAYSMNCMLNIVDYMVYILENLEPKSLFYELYAEYSRLHGIYSCKPLNLRVYSMNCMLIIVVYMVYILANP